MAMKIVELAVYSVAWADAYLRTKWHLDPSSRLTTTDMSRKVGGCCAPFGVGSWVISNNVSLAETNLPTTWHLHPSSRLATTLMGRKFGAVPLLGRHGSPSAAMWPGPRPSSMPSGILMRPFGHNTPTSQTDRQTDRTDNGPIA